MSNVRNARRPAMGRAAGAGALDEAQNQDLHPNYKGFSSVCQPSTIEALKRKAAYHRWRAECFATMADVAWRFGDVANRRKMQRAQWAEARLLDSVVRVLLDAGEVGHE